MLLWVFKFDCFYGIKYNKKYFFQAKALEELDAEFGIGDLVEDEIRNERREAYSARDLRGLTVEHSVVSFIDWNY